MGSVRKSPRNSARWEARYRDVYGRQRTKTFLSRADAKAWLSATETDMRRGSWIDPRKASVRVEIVAQHWLEAGRSKRPGSIARDISILQNHIIPVLGASRIGSITRTEVQRLVDDWSARFRPSTTVRVYACLRALFSYAELSELIARSPCRNVRLPEAHPRESQILDDQSMVILADALGNSAPMLYLAVLGLRWGEVAGLRVADLDFLRCTVTVARQRTRGAKGRMVEQEPKTRAGRRTLSVPESIMKTLAEHLVNGGSAAEIRKRLSLFRLKVSRCITPIGGGVSGYRPETGPDWAI